jgi:hypothetical protein
MPDPISFLPSQDGLAFTNAWPSEPAVVLPTPFGKINIGNAAAGLCGGMVFAALDFWHTGIQPPATRPAPGEPLYRYIVRRLVDSWHLPAGVAQYYQWMNLPDGDSGFEVFGRRVVTDRGLAWRTIQTQWPQIAADLDHGTPAALGVVTVASASPADLGFNHQVLAYGYDASPSQVTSGCMTRTAVKTTASTSGSTRGRRPSPRRSRTISTSATLSGASSAPPTPRPRHPLPDACTAARQPEAPGTTHLG